jgi:ATP-dependent helicase/DNAse subunit B
VRDEKGQLLLAAGFLDELRARIAPDALAAVSEEMTRIDPALLDRLDLAQGPADARVRAVGLACLEHNTAELSRLAGLPRHRAALLGSAAALALTASRRAYRDFGPYDGRLADRTTQRAVTAGFGPEVPFSPSQLESYLFCPFQFFIKYVLRLLPVDERDETDEDYARRGEVLHSLLEQLETLHKRDGGDLLKLSRIVIETEMRAELTVTSEADPGLNAIETRRIEQTLGRYVTQAADYQVKAGAQPAQPHLFEVGFGDPRRDDTRPCLQIGDGPGAVRVRGKIDRVDVVSASGRPGFRVIDYKTGAPPSGREVKENLMVQLPLYALAVQRLGLVDEAAELLDVGYWDLREKGFRRIELKNWEEAAAGLEAAVLEAAARLRSGRFDVDPRRDGCQSSCDYSNVCRIAQIRSVRRPAERAKS